MRKLYKIVFFTALILICQKGFSQFSLGKVFNTYSPYSVYGLGDVRFSGTADLQGMGGGFKAYTSPVFVNLSNPASFSSFRLTTLNIGGDYSVTGYKQGTSKDLTQELYLNNILLSFPLFNKAGLVVGLSPYSSTGYSVTDTTRVNSTETTLGNLMTDYFYGTGGLNSVYLGAGFEIFKNFSLGFNVSYLFGSINRGSYNELQDRLFQTKIDEENWIRGWDFLLGLNYNFKIKDDIKTFIGATYSISADLKSSIKRKEYVVTSINGSYTEGQIGSIYTDKTVSFRLPQRLAAGVGFGNLYKWYLGADYSISEKSEIEQIDFSSSQASYNSEQQISIGANFTPRYNSVNSYMARVNYKMGGYYKRTGLVLNSTNIDDFGFSLGASFPITKATSQTSAISNLNIFFNFGQKGTTSNDLVRQRYFKLGLSFALMDKWFMQTKFY